MRYNLAKRQNIHDGKVWTYRTAEELHLQYPEFSRASIARYLQKLEDMGAIESGNFNKHKYDRTKWYTVTGLEKVFSSEGPVNTDFSDCANAKQQSETTIPTLNTDSKTKPICPSGDEQDVDKSEMKLTKKQIEKAFDHVWDKYHHKQGKKKSRDAYEKRVKHLDIEGITKFNEHLLQSFGWRNHDNTPGWDRLLLSSYLNGERDLDQAPSNGRQPDNPDQNRERFINLARQLLSGTWPSIRDLDDITKRIIQNGINEDWVKNPDNLEKLAKFGFKTR
jgi:hypothetical protein